MIDKVHTFIAQEIGLEASAMVFVALSGGADSTALLLILRELGYRLHALHCNFHLRGEESNRDQRFVEELCQRLDVPLSVRHFDTAAVAKRRGISIEMAARDLRYEWFREKVKRLKGEKVKKLRGEKVKRNRAEGFSTFQLFNFSTFVAVGHHQDDQAETLLLNLLRGTGLRGLAGMSPRSENIIRPLLCLSHSEILAFLEQRGQPYVTDSSNSERTFQRNRLRLDVIPLLRSINPKAVEHLCRASENVSRSIPYYNMGIEEAFRKHGITANVFPLAALTERTLLHEWLFGKGFNAAQEDEMMRSGSGQPGAEWTSEHFLVLRDRDVLLLCEREQELVPPVLLREMVSCIGETGPDIAYFDADLLTKPLEVRLVRSGDCFVPLGMKGRKLVSDYLTDRKLSRIEKQRQFVVTHGDDIIWLIGHRSDGRFRVTPATRHILRLTVER